MLPPVMDEQYTATRNTIAGTGCIEYVNGRPSATAIVALTPGSAPKIVPTTIANTTIKNVYGSIRTLKPFVNNSHVVMITSLLYMNTDFTDATMPSTYRENSRSSGIVPLGRLTDRRTLKTIYSTNVITTENTSSLKT